MIINTGCRTDIPAYYSEWFYNRIKEGSVLVRNPYYPQQVTKYSLSPEVVDCLVFCTKNPMPMLNRMDEIQKYHQFWFVTITPYGKEIEPYVPEKELVLESFQRLSEKVGLQSVSWRYDPIFISEQYSLDFHMRAFQRMAEKLEGYTDNCVISFIDLYEKTKRNFPEVQMVTKEQREYIGAQFAEIGKRHGITIRSCCEGSELAKFGVDISGCMTNEILERAVEGRLEVPKSKGSTREACNCLMGNDIGMYNTCGHGCIYCYANYDRKTVMNNMQMHNSESLLLIGELQKEDIVKEAKQVSYYNGQMELSFL